MDPDQVELTIHPLDRATYVRLGTPFVEVARHLRIPLNLPCGGEGNCGKCRVRVQQGVAPPTEADRRHFTPDELAQGYRLACQLVLNAPLVVALEPESLTTGQYQILTSAGQVCLRRESPPVEKVLMTCRVPEGVTAIDRLCLRDGGARPSLDGLRELATMVAKGEPFTAILAEDALIGCEPEDTTCMNYGVAFDLGTTTLVASLVDVTTGEELAVAARPNPQMQFGDDVISRIQFACEHPQGLAQLESAIREACRALVDDLVQQTGVRRDHIYQATCAGNTTMQHLFCGLHPFTLGRYPFRPITLESVRCEARTVGLELHPRSQLYVFPAIGGFVGGDTVAGILTSGLLEGETPALLVDLGTNGEIVVYDGGELYAAATAAGPAFEGANIGAGMRASRGAIEQIWWDRDRGLQYRVIGQQRPAGLCGSALLDLLALLLESGLVTPQGRMVPPGEISTSGDRSADQLLGNRIVFQDEAAAFMVVPADATSTGRPIIFTQRDVRQLQLAIGAIRAGTEILLSHLGISPSQLQAVYLAGGFGNYIRRRNAQRVGLLPPGVPTAKIRFSGNTSLLGAKLALVSREIRQKAEVVARRVHHVDLSRDPNFRWRFAEAMIFPEPPRSPGNNPNRGHQ